MDGFDIRRVTETAQDGSTLMEGYLLVTYQSDTLEPPVGRLDRELGGEDAQIVAALQAIADRKGTTLLDEIREALRRQVFLDQ